MDAPKSNPENPSAAQTVLSASVKGTTFLILLQVVSRALTFAVNQLLLRFLSPQLLVVLLQLELYSVSVLYFARESVRVAAQRQTEDVQSTGQKSESAQDSTLKTTKMQEVINIAYIPITLGPPLAWGLAAFYLSKADDHVLSTPRFENSLKIFAFAALLELMTEPCFMALQLKMLYKTRAGIETTATIFKCLLIFGTTFYAHRTGNSWGVLPFAVGQAGYAITVFIAYFWAGTIMSAKDGFSLLANPISTTYVTSTAQREDANMP